MHTHRSGDAHPRIKKITSGHVDRGHRRPGRPNPLRRDHPASQRPTWIHATSKPCWCRCRKRSGTTRRPTYGAGTGEVDPLRGLHRILRTNRNRLRWRHRCCVQHLSRRGRLVRERAINRLTRIQVNRCRARTRRHRRPSIRVNTRHRRRTTARRRILNNRVCTSRYIANRAVLTVVQRERSCTGHCGREPEPGTTRWNRHLPNDHGARCRWQLRYSRTYSQSFHPQPR